MRMWKRASAWIDLLKAVEAERLRYVPGEDWAYANAGYRTIAHPIERASGQPLADAVADLASAAAMLKMLANTRATAIVRPLAGAQCARIAAGAVAILIRLVSSMAPAKIARNPS
jgi:hypothetical protein